MNSNTREALKQFASAVELLAQGVMHQIGVDNATEIINSAEALKAQLDSDETIV